MGWLDSFKGAFGLDRGSSGGTRSAFEQYGQYTGDVESAINRRMAEINAQGVNPLVNQFGRSYQGLDTAMQQAASGATRLNNLAGALPRQLRNSALASSQGAMQGSANAARLASSGRGGAAFGGGAGALAMRGAQQASVGQSSALAQAMSGATQMQMQAQQAATGIQQQAVQQRFGLAQAREGALGQQAGLYEAFRGRQDAMRLADIQMRTQLGNSSLYAGLQGDQAMSQGRRGLIGMAGSFFGG